MRDALVVEVMHMTPVERAKADVSRMEGEMNRLRGLISSLQARLLKAQGYIEMAAIYEADEPAASDSLRGRGGVSFTAVRAAVDFISERGGPMHTRDILKELAARGITIGGGNPVANLSGFLSRSDELRSSRTDGWGLAQWGEPLDEGKSETDASSEIDTDASSEIDDDEL